MHSVTSGSGHLRRNAVGQTAEIFDVSSERASREVRDYLRELRPALQLTQKELSHASETLPTPISREFIANLETSGLPGTVRKFLSYAWLTGADLQLLAELAVAGSYEVEPGLSIDQLIGACRRMVESGQHREALALARSAAREASGEGTSEPGRVGSLLIAASIAAKQGGFWRVQRELAEEAYCASEKSKDSAARALVLIASALDSLGRERLAVEFLDLIDKSSLDADPALAAAYWGQKCILLWRTEEFQEAISAADRSLALLREAEDEVQLALVLSVKSHILVEVGDLDGACLLAMRALESLEASGERGAVRRTVLCDVARVETLSGNLDSAARLLHESRELALESGHELHVFEARVGLCRLAHAQGNYGERDRLARLLRLSAPRVGYDPIRRRDYERLLDEMHQGGIR